MKCNKSSIPHFLNSSTRSLRYYFVRSSQNHSVTYFCNENQVAECSNDEGIGMYRSPGHFDTILLLTPRRTSGSLSDLLNQKSDTSTSSVTVSEINKNPQFLNLKDENTV